MARYRGTTTERGLGSQHQATRRTLHAQLRDGDPCARCGGPMYRSQWPYLDVDDFPGRMYGGPQVKRLSHRYCNRAAGARMGNARRGVASVWRSSRRW